MTIHRIIIGAICVAIIQPLWAIEIPLGGVRTFSGGEQGKESAVMAYVDIEAIFQEHPMKKRLQEEYLAEVDKRKSEIAAQNNAIGDLEKVIVSSTTELNRGKLEIDILRSQIFMASQTQPPAQAAAAAVPAAPVSTLAPNTTHTVLIAVSSTSSVAANCIIAVSSSPAATVVNSPIIAAKEASLKTKEEAIAAMKKEVEQKKDELNLRIKKDRAELAELEEKNSNAVLADIYAVLQKVSVEEGVTIIIDKKDVLYAQAARDLTDKVRERLTGR